MIYITDNGGEYSDHAIYFYELPDDVPVEDGVYLCERQPGESYYRSNRRVIAVAPCLDWREPSATECPVEFDHLRAAFGVGTINSRHHDYIKRCPPSLLSRVIEDARRAHVKRGEQVAPAWAPRKIKDGDPNWRPMMRELEEAAQWISAGAPLPQISDGVDDDDD